MLDDLAEPGVVVRPSEETRRRGSHRGQRQCDGEVEEVMAFAGKGRGRKQETGNRVKLEKSARTDSARRALRTPRLQPREADTGLLTPGSTKESFRVSLSS